MIANPGDNRESARPLRLLHIVPGLVAGECGLGDFAVNLARGLLDYGIESSLIAAGVELAERSGEYEGCGFPFVAVAPGSSDALERALAATAHDAVLLHYSGYGFERTGTPTWLVKALSSNNANSGAATLTFMHETWQRPSIFSKRLYRSLFQRRVARQLCQQSDAILTNTYARAEQLGRYHAEGCKFLPVFSNIGENYDLSNKDPGLALIFGLPRRRRMAWESLAQNTKLIERLGIRRIIDIGAASFELPEQLRSITERQGKLKAVDASAAMTRAEVTFMHYGSDELGKSGVFAAFAAHRLCVINLGEDRGVGGDGLIAGKHYLRTKDVAQGTSCPNLAAPAEALLSWYRPHDLAATAAQFSAVLREAIHDNKRHP